MRDIRTSDVYVSHGVVCLLDEGETFYFTNFSREEGREPDGAIIPRISHCKVALDVKTGRERFRLGLAPPFSSKLHCLAPDGKSFFTYGGECFRRDLATGKVLGRPLTGYRGQGGHRVFALTADGRRAAVAHQAGWYWANADLEPVHPHLKDLAEVHYLSDHQIRIRDGEHTYRNWELRDGKFVLPLERRPLPEAVRRGTAHFCPLRRLALHTDSKQLVVFHLETGREQCRLQDISYQGKQMHWPVFSRDSQRVLLPRADGADVLACWYDTQTGRELGRHRITPAAGFRGYPPVNDAQDSPGLPAIDWYADDGSEFGYVTRDSRLVLVDCATGKVRLTLTPRSTTVGNEPGNPREATWDYGTRRGHPCIIATRQFSQGACEYVFHDRISGAVLRRVALPAIDKDVPVLSPDLRLAFVVSRAHGVRVHETASGREFGTIPAAGTTPATVSLFPDGKRLATGSPDTTILLWDLDRPLGGKPDLPLPRSPREAEPLWEMLGAPDPKGAEPALWALRRAPGPALALLKERLQPARPPQPEQLQRWIVQLDSDSFQEREDAVQQLLRVGEQVLPALRAALKQPASAEQQRRLETLIGRLEDPHTPPGCLRELRALEVLERLGGDEARRLVQGIAAGHGDDLLSREARLILDRWR
jgi:hypothetical protein